MKTVNFIKYILWKLHGCCLRNLRKSIFGSSPIPCGEGSLIYCYWGIFGINYKNYMYLYRYLHVTQVLGLDRRYLILSIDAMGLSCNDSVVISNSWGELARRRRPTDYFILTTQPNSVGEVRNKRQNP